MKRGVYTITCTANHAIYIGQSQNIQERFHQHKCKLRKGTHCNPHLQMAWKKYGADAFVFKAHTLASDAATCDRLEQEIFARSLASGMRLFNIRPATATNKGVKFSPSTKRKLSRAAKRQFQTPEARARHSMAIRGTDKPCRLLSPDGLLCEFLNPTEFAQQHGLERSSLLKLLRGGLHSYRGWTNPDIQLPPKKSCKLTPAQREEICKRYAKGEGSTQLIEEFGVSKNGLYTLLRNRGIPRISKREVNLRRWGKR